MRRNTSKLRFGTDIDRGGVRMLHAAARSLRPFADVKNEKVMIERRSAHQFDFVPANLAQLIFRAGLVPSVAVNRNGDRRFGSGDTEKFELANFDRPVGKCVIVLSRDGMRGLGAALKRREVESRGDGSNLKKKKERGGKKKNM